LESSASRALIARKYFCGESVASSRRGGMARIFFIEKILGEYFFSGVGRKKITQHEC